MHLAHYLGLLHRAQTDLADAFRDGGAGARRRARRLTPVRGSRRSATRHAERLAPFAERYGEEADDEPDRLHARDLPGRPRAARSACCATCTTST